MIPEVSIEDLIGFKSKKEVCGNNSIHGSKSLVIITEITQRNDYVSYEVIENGKVVYTNNNLRPSLEAYNAIQF